MADPSRYAGLPRRFVSPPPPTAADRALPSEWLDLLDRLDRLERHFGQPGGKS